eukprot:3789081-Amphidinium_carterae.1
MLSKEFNKNFDNFLYDRSRMPELSSAHPPHIMFHGLLQLQCYICSFVRCCDSTRTQRNKAAKMQMGEWYEIVGLSLTILVIVTVSAVEE